MIILKKTLSSKIHVDCIKNSICTQVVRIHLLDYLVDIHIYASSDEIGKTKKEKSLAVVICLTKK